MPLILYYSTSQAQNCFKIRKPSLVEIGNGRLFSLRIADSCLTIGDTVEKVVRVIYGDSAVIAYKLQIVTDSGFSTVVCQDSLLMDSLRYKELLSTDSIRNSSNFRLLLIGSDNLSEKFPVEAIYQRIATPKLPIGLLDSIKKEKPVKVGGDVTIIGQLSDDKYLYQTIPQNYIRGYVNLNLELFGLPFSTGYGYSTESNSGANKINNFRLSFNHDQFYNNIREKIEKKVEDNKLNQVKRFTHIEDIGSIDEEFNKLLKELESKGFRKELEKNKSVIDLGEKDSSFKKSYRYKKAYKRQVDYEQKLDRLKELEKLKRKYDVYSRLADIDVNMFKYNLNKPKDFRKASKRYGFVKPGQSLLLSVKRIDLGTFDPQYTALVLSGVSLTGFNLEVNPGYLYSAITVGKAISNVENPFDFSTITKGRNIVSGRIGIGNKDKLLVAFSLLKGTDHGTNKKNDSVAVINSAAMNYVVGMDITYKVSSGVDIGLEYAKSHNEYFINESKDVKKGFESLFDTDKGKYENAWNAFANFSLGPRTKFKTMTRIVDPFYSSFGTPYLRKDNFRTEVKGEQSIWKDQFNLSITYRRDADNIHGFKQGTSVNNALIFNGKIRIKKCPYVILTWSPNYQQTYNASVNKQITNEVKFYNVIVGYVYKSSTFIANTSFSYVRQYSRSNQAEMKSFDVSQYGVSENIQIKEINLAITGMAAYTLPALTGDTGRALSLSLNGSQGLFENKIVATAGGKYLNDFTIEERYIVEAGTAFGLGWGISCQINAEKHFIHPFISTNNPKDMVLGRITIIKTF